MPGLVKENEGTERKVKYTSKFNELMELDDWMHSAPVPTWRCTGPRTKAHFTFQTSQEKCQYHRLITTLLLSQQLPPWLPPQNLLLQTGWCPHCSTIVSCSSSQWYSGCLFPSFLQILPSIKSCCFPENFGLLQPIGISPSGDSWRNTEIVGLGPSLALQCLQ